MVVRHVVLSRGSDIVPAQSSRLNPWQRRLQSSSCLQAVRRLGLHLNTFGEKLTMLRSSQESFLFGDVFWPLAVVVMLSTLDDDGVGDGYFKEADAASQTQDSDRSKLLSSKTNYQLKASFLILETFELTMSNPLVVNITNLAAFTPAETAELVSRAGVKKGNTRPDKIFLSAVSAGCLLSFGCAVSLTALTAPWYQENAPGLIKLMGAAVFPLGLVMVVLTGADLFTATTMVSRRVTPRAGLSSLTCFPVHHGGCPPRPASGPQDAPPLVPVLLWESGRLTLRHGHHHGM